MALSDLPKCVIPERPFELTLNDCLACSGCMTLDEKKINLADIQKHNVNIILSDYVVVDVYHKFVFESDPANKNNFINFQDSLYKHLQNIFKLNKILTTEKLRKINFNLILNELLSFTAEKKPLILTECPGVVTYIEKRRPELIPYLSKILSMQQIAVFLLSDKNTKIISVMQCTDKSLEKDFPIDYSLTSKDFFEILKETDFNVNSMQNENKIADKKEIVESRPAKEKLNTIIYKNSIIPHVVEKYSLQLLNKRSVNTSFHVYQFENQKNEIFQIAQVTNLKNLLNILSFKKKDIESPFDVMNYHLVDIYLCEGRCNNGPGLISDLNNKQELNQYFEIRPKINQQSDITVKMNDMSVICDKDELQLKIGNLKHEKRKFINRKRIIANFNVEW